MDTSLCISSTEGHGYYKSDVQLVRMSVGHSLVSGMKIVLIHRALTFQS